VTIFDRWTARWIRLSEICASRGFSDRWEAGRAKPMRCEIGPPAAPAAVAEVERAIGRSIPAALREVMLSFSAEVCVQWQLRDVDPPAELHGIFAGECRWSLEGLPALIEVHRDWVEKAFPDPTDEYDSVWHRKFPILSVGTGDMVAIAPEEPGAPVIYLSRDGSSSHGCVLARDFIDYVERSSILGCVGAEDWQWQPFVEGPTSGLLPDGPNGKRWRAWLGLD
jgi:hypothetical protein